MWLGIHGHDDVASRFGLALGRGRLANTYLFVGPGGIGKRTFAQRLAETLLCTASPAEKMAPCGVCDSCVQALAGTHPDLLVVEKPADKSTIPLSLLVGDDDRRMRQGLCHDLALRPFMGGRKVAIIDDADHLSEECANALLKTLEEPPPDTVLILIGTSADRQLPTIRSRAQIIRFRPLDAPTVAQILVDSGLASDPNRAARLAAHAEGSIQRALDLSDDALWEFRASFLTALAQERTSPVALAEQVCSFVEAAGKEAPPRRARARQAINFAVEFSRQLLRAQSGMSPEGDDVLRQAVTRACQTSADPSATVRRIERSLTALEHVDRNAHQTALLECWIDDWRHNRIFDS